jgi:transcription antitermination factor NusG
MSDSKLGMRWYIVHTMSNYERKAGDAIKIEIDRALLLKENNINRAIEKNKNRTVITRLRKMKKEFASRFGEIKVSLHETSPAKKGARTRTISKYPGYIFMRLDLELNEESDLDEIFQKQIIQEVRLTVVKPHRVTRLGDPLNDRDIDNIEENVVENPQHNFTVGSSVQISKGQFSNLVGKITNIQGPKLTVEISMFGQPTKVNIKAIDCESIEQS